MKKVVMNLENYIGKYAMHCPTEESANLFLDFLRKKGRNWISGTSYDEKNFWANYKELTSYSFNEGEYCYLNFYKDNGYTILEIDDFIVDVPVTREKIENLIFQRAKDIFRLYKMYNPDGEYLCFDFVADDEDKNKFTFTANNECYDEEKVDNKLPVSFHKEFTLED